MAIVQASDKGVAKLELLPSFKVQAVGTVPCGVLDTVAYTFKPDQARLLGVPEFLVDYQSRNYGVCMIHESYLVVS